MGFRDKTHHGLRFLSFALALALSWSASCNLVLAQTAALVPNASQQFFNALGQPLAGGSVYFFVPNTTTPKTVWSDQNQTIPFSQPITLDAGGFPQNGSSSNVGIFGQGNYREQVFDSSANLIFDGFTSAYGSSAPSGANGTDTAPVGTVMPFSGFAIPTNWQLAYGQALSRSTFSQLLGVLTISTPTGNCVTTSTTLSGFTSTSQIPVGSHIESTCLPTGTTVASIVNATTITVNNAATATGTFTLTDFPWGNGDGVSTFNVPDLRGRVVAGPDSMGGTAANRLTSTYYGSSAATPGIAGGNQSNTTTTTLSQANLPNANFAVSGITLSQTPLTASAHVMDSGFTGGTVSLGSGNTNQGTLDLTGSGILTLGGGAVSVTNQGSAASGGTSAPASSAAFSVVQPTLTTNYIIKVAPNTTGAGGVVSLGGMFGDIICGANLVCANQTISATGGGGGGSLAVGVTPITGGAVNNLLADNGGTLIELSALPNGTTAVTQASTDATTKIATDQFVQNALVGAGLVTSVFGRAGNVVAISGDYSCSMVTGALCAANNLSDITNAGTARTNLGLGTFATQNFATPPVIGAVTPNSATFTALSATGTTNIVNGPFQFAGNTIVLPSIAATLTYKSGTFVPGDCLQVASSGSGGALGAISDAGAACGSGGGGGGSSANTQTFVAGVNFTSGVTTSLTLSGLPVSAAALQIYEDGVAQPSNGTNILPSQWTVNLSTGVVTFTQPIQAQSTVYAQWISPSISGGTVSSVSVVTANGFGGSVASPTTTPAITLTTSITGVLAGSGGALTAASVTGTGSVVQSVSPTITSPTFGGTVAGANTIPLSVLAQSGANTMLGNWTSGTANVTANSMPSCSDTGGNHLNYVSGTGITCGTSGSGINQLTGDVTAGPGTGSQAATIASNAVTFAKFQQVAAVSLVGNPTGSLANAEGITLGSTLGFSGTTLNCTTATTSQLGCVKPDGTSISISAGTISVIGTPATSLTVGTTAISGGSVGQCLFISTGPVLGAQSCGTATSIAVGTTTITSGTSGYILYNNAGVLGNEQLVPASAGGTGVNNPGTITVGGNTTFSGSFTFTGTVTGNTSVTFPTSGTLAALGNANTWNGAQTLQGGVLTSRRTITSGASDTVLATDYLIAWDKASGSASAESLFACASGIDGKVYVIKDEKGDAATNNITITPVSGTIEGASNAVLNSNNASVTLQCDASTTNWVVE